MDRAWLAAQLDSGRSIESIARDVGLDSSTVGYWVAKHGLTSHHAERHAARGSLGRDALQAAVGEGLSVRQLGERFDRSDATIRYWLEKYGLQTHRAIWRNAPVLVGPDGQLERECRRHGRTEFLPRPDGAARCLKCRSEAVSIHRRRTKAVLVEEAGGACAICGYDRSPAALHFHHVRPIEKSFHLALGGYSRSLSRMRAEARKCVLLCANCHAEVEAGLARLPTASEECPG